MGMSIMKSQKIAIMLLFAKLWRAIQWWRFASREKIYVFHNYECSTRSFLRVKASMNSFLGFIKHSIF